LQPGAELDDTDADVRDDRTRPGVDHSQGLLVKDRRMPLPGHEDISVCGWLVCR